MDDWEKFNEISLPGKEDFYSNLNMEGIIDTDYTQTKGVCKDFEKKIRRISWQTALKSTEVILDLLTDINMLLMVEERY